MNLDRRETIKLLGSAASISLLPLAAVAEPSADLLALRDRVQKLIDDLDLTGQIKQLPAQYRQFCQEVPVAHSECKKCEAGLRDRSVHIATANGEQRFVSNIKHRPVELGFIADDVTPFDLPATLLGLMKAFKEYREYEAADLLNKGWAYNPEIGGDGQAMFSESHPHDDGVWSNTLSGPLAETNLLHALVGIRTNAVDESGIKIKSTGELLIVPVAQTVEAYHMLRTELYPGMTMPEANAALTLPGKIGRLSVNDYLTDNDNWFVKTSIPGIIMSEYQPFTVTAEIDADSKKVIVVGREIRGFGHTDPRAMFGVRGKVEAVA